MSAASIESEKLADLINKFIPEELGIRVEFVKNITLLGIDPEKNIALFKSGFYASVFIIPEKKIVIKFFQRENEESNVTFPNDSKYLLQPFCHTDILSNPLAIFPLLNTTEITAEAVFEMRAELEKEGYLLADDKPENVGISDSGVSYVIDADAAMKIKIGEARTGRESQWRFIDPAFRTDQTPNPDLAMKAWQFDDMVSDAMFGTFRATSAERLAGSGASMAPPSRY